MKALVISSVWVEPTSTAAGSRMLQLLSILLENNWEITYATTAIKSDHAFDLEQIGIATQIIKLNDSDFDDFVVNLNPDMVLFDRFMVEEQFGWRISEYCPRALKILDTEDLHFLRKARQQAVKENENSQVLDLYTTEAKREIASIYRCDLTLIISQYEMHLLQEVFNISPSLLFYLPFLVDKLDHNFLPFASRSHFVCIGNCMHPPNWDAILELKKHIWPKIKSAIPKAELHVYGSYMTHKVLQLHNNQDCFLIKGRADNAQDVLSRARVLLAPLRFGAGLKGKFIDGMQCGTPSVTTQIGAEAMAGDLPWCGAVENDYSAFAKAATTLYTEEQAWKTAQENGVNIINQNFQKSQFTEAIICKIDDLLSNLKSHRRQNFIGEILQHHTLQSTKYMSKWIEEKNKE